MEEDRQRYPKIKKFVKTVIEPSIVFIKKNRKKQNTPFKEIESILNIFFPGTKHISSGAGAFKRVFIIHTPNKKKLALKISRRRSYMRKDYTTYKNFIKRIGANIGHRNYAKIYWRTDFTMLQKFGKAVKVPEEEIQRLKQLGKEYGLKDIREKNIMKVDGKFKIVDAERKQKKNNVSK